MACSRSRADRYDRRTESLRKVNPLTDTMRARGRRVRLTRSAAILKLRHELERGSYPRIQMSLIVALTGGAGFLASFLLLHAGVASMAVRYPLALLAAYFVFLLLLWAWLHLNTSDLGDGSGAGDLLDVAADLPDLVPSRTAGDAASAVIRAGRGGDFGGGGASASFDDVVPARGLLDSDAIPSSVGEAAGSVFEADELAIPLLVVLLAIGLALASFYIVYAAPALFAELLFDGVLSFTLYRHLRKTDDPHWLMTAVRKTALPFAITAVVLAGVGFGLAHYAPGARTLSQAVSGEFTAR
jgi:hypothetical protein